MENEKRIFLHIGMHKTATSSIQSSLYKNISLLKSIKDGYFYSKKWEMNNSIPLYSLFANNPNKYHIHIRNNRTEEEILEFNEIRKNDIIYEINDTLCENFIFSGEDVSFLNKDECIKLKNFLHEHITDKIKVIIFIRHPVSYLASCTQQKIKEGTLVEISPEYAQWIKDFYKNTITNFIKIFGKKNVFVYKFEAACLHKRGPVGFFMEKIGIPQEFINKIDIVKTNQGISNNALDLIKAVNGTIPLFKNGKMSEHRTSNDTYYLQNVTGGGNYILPDSIIEEVEQYTANDKKWLKNNFKLNYESELINREKNIVVYDDLYYQEVLNNVFKCSDVIKYICYEFFKSKFSTISEDEGKGVMKRIIDYYNENYPIIANSKDFLDQIHIKEKHNSAKARLLEYINNNDADFYKEIALVCESHGKISTALYFMTLAMNARPEGVFICKKVNEYKSILNL